MVLDDNLIEQLSTREVDIEKLLTIQQHSLDEREETGIIINTVNGRNIRETGLRLERVDGKPITELVKTYKNIGILPRDLNRAFSVIKATKEKFQVHSENRDTKDNFESR